MKTILKITKKKNCRISNQFFSNFSLLLSIFSLLIFLPSCQNDDEINCNTYKWEYFGDEAPDTWPICTAECGGQSQSPVNITGAVTDNDLKVLVTNYKPVPINLINNGHTLQFNYDDGSTINVNGEEYKLLQFHFHGLSEHTVDEKQFPLEVHLVHQNAAGDLAVVGVFFEAGSENTFLSNFTGNLPVSEDQNYTSEDMVNVEDVLPTETGYYTYSGSLTTPPCSEIVTWLVMRSPVEASNNQIQEMNAILKDNFRPIQALNGRQIAQFN